MIEMIKMQGLRGRKVVDRVRRHGKKWKGKHMGICYVVNRRNEHLPAGRQGLTINNEQLLVGTSASKKLHKSAVKRNKMRRRCREALRVTIKEQTNNQKLITPNLQLLLQPRSSSLKCDFEELKADTNRFIHDVLS